MEEILKAVIKRYTVEFWAYIELGFWYKDHGEDDEAIKIFKDMLRLFPDSDNIYDMLSHLYNSAGRRDLGEEHANKDRQLRLNRFNAVTRDNYHKLKTIADKEGIKLVCAQYPMRSIEPLKKMLKPYGDDIIFVDNEKVFKEAVRQGKYEDYFCDSFGGDFGHCTVKGNRLLAENIANVILKRVFLE